MFILTNNKYKIVSIIIICILIIIIKSLKTLLVIHVDRMLNVQTIFNKKLQSVMRNILILLCIYALIYDVCCDLEMHAQHIFLF